MLGQWDESGAYFMKEVQPKQKVNPTEPGVPDGRVLIHFVHNVGGNWRVACIPGPYTTVRGDVTMRSDDPRAVNCPLCMQSNIFTDRMIAVRAGEAGTR